MPNPFDVLPSDERMRLRELLADPFSRDLSALPRDIRVLLTVALADKDIVAAISGVEQGDKTASIVGEIQLELHVYDPKRKDRKSRSFDLQSIDDGYRIVMTDGTESFDDGTIVSIEAFVRDASGAGIRIDLDPSVTPPGQTNHPELLGKLRYEAYAQSNDALLGAIGGLGLDNNGHFEGPVHFLDPQPPKGPGAWRRSGGVWAECAVRQACYFVISLDGVRHARVYTPEVR